MPPLIDFRHVTVWRGNATSPALDDVHLRIEAGEHVCIFGPNGCGKSTLIKTITRECYPAAAAGASAQILGRERWDIFRLRNLLGIVSPDVLGSCTSEATGRDVLISAFSAAAGSFRTTVRRQSSLRGRNALLRGWAWRTWPAVR